MDSLSVKRRLTCILAADAVGFSSQMGRDEEGTIRVLSAHRAVIDGIIAFHQGRIVGTAGDSVLAEFASAVEAVRCAIEIQDAIKTRNDSLPEDRRMHFRIGVNLGDVVVKNDDLLGDGVNVAARLESIAEPGGICISSSVYDQITGKLDLGFQDIGEQALKNISRPIRVYRVSGTAPPARPAPPPAAPARKSGALLVGAGAAGAVLVLAAVAWQMGWLRAGPGDGGRTGVAVAPSPAASTAPATPPTPATTDADAKRAQADAESARIRTDAEALKRQAEAEVARNRAEAEAARTARTRADADAAAARVRAQAEADAARIRAEAERQAAKAAAPRQADVSPAPAVVAAAAPARAASAPAPAPDAAPRASANTAFDGNWNVVVTCPAHADGTAGYAIDVAARVKDGYLRGERGAEGTSNSLRIEGEIRPDGSALLSASGYTGDPKYSVGHIAARSPYRYTVKAQFEGLTGTGKRVELRPCELRFARQ